jgi:hypothetical protein
MKRPQIPSKLSESVHHQLNLYALAATAAGVSVLALAQAEAKIIYTPANLKILPKHKYYLQINHDGVRHFEIWDRVRYFGDFLNVLPLQKGNEIWGPTAGGLASALSSGVQIGTNSSSRLRATNSRMAWQYVSSCTGACVYKTGGDWLNVQNRYLGLKFIVKGETHYGWVRLSISGFKGTMSGYAYETTPNMPIKAGQIKWGDATGSLGALARGAK